MQAKKLLIVSLTSILLSGMVMSQKVDPYHKDTGGFGYLIEKMESFTLWWCEGAYKVMLDTPIPSEKKEKIEILSAKNEFESFQLVINPNDSISDLVVELSDLSGRMGSISSSNIELRQVEYVNVTKPTDSYGYKGMWPDPLPCIPDTLSLVPGSNLSLWISVYVPPSTLAGSYSSSLIFRSGEWSYEVPFTLKVWDFTLPKESSMRSGFGLSVDKIAEYQNIEKRDDLIETFDLYMKAFKDYKISPYNFYYLHPIRKLSSGLYWKGGYFDSKSSYNDNYSLRIEDDSRTEAINSSYTEFLSIKESEEYTLKWMVKSEEPEQQYTMVIEAYDKANVLMRYENRVEAYTAGKSWSGNKFKLGSFDKEVAKLKLNLYPTFRSETGEETGIVWFDNLSLSGENDKTELIKQGDFEVNADSIDISLDFTDFDYAAQRYLDEFGFNSFRLNLEGMGSGTYYSRTDGVFEGFAQNTPEYDKLMGQYLSQIEKHLKEKGWLGKEYVYWFDEPGKRDYPFVREGMELIKKSAPGITTFLTENDPGPEIMDVTDVTCTIWHRIDPKKAGKVRDGGQGYWSYLCTAPKAPWVSEFIDHDAINLRIWLWMSYSYRLNGILIWSSNYWNSRAASPEGYLQNPWEQAASFVQGYGWPEGKQTVWGNGDGRFWYPPNRDPNNDNSTYIKGPVPSLRLEFLRQGIEDYEYFTILENLLNDNENINKNLRDKALSLLDIPKDIFSSGKDYTRDPKLLISYRERIAEMIINIQNKTKKNENL